MRSQHKFQVKFRLDDHELQLKSISEDFYSTKKKVEEMEKHLPSMIREIVDHYSATKFKDQLDNVVGRAEFDTKVNGKVDHREFNNYVRTQQHRDAINDKEYKTDERLFMLETGLGKTVTKEDFTVEMKGKGSNNKLMELKNTLSKF